MDKLEQYLDQVCRTIAGPRALRQHIREELREHLTDAIDERVSHGLPRDEALARALEDFGGADQVRSELEATHGHRVFAVVIDKALQWKEQTMKAKWIWSTFAHVALLLVIAIELFFLVSTTIFVTPKFQQIITDIWNSPSADQAQTEFAARSISLFHFFFAVGDIAIWIVIAIVILWAIFEWRVRSENKSFMRLSALASVAVVLAVLSVMLSAAMILPTVMAVPTMRSELPEALVAHDVSQLDRSVTAIEQAAQTKNWQAMQDCFPAAMRAISNLSNLGAAAPSIVASTQEEKVHTVRQSLRSAQEALLEARSASFDRDASRLSSALARFHQAYGALPVPTTSPASH
jgi:hypothetical protein